MVSPSVTIGQQDGRRGNEMRVMDCLASGDDGSWLDKAGVYLIEIGERFYVGSTKEFRSRIGDHKSALRNGRHGNPIMQRAFKKHRSLIVHCLEVVPCYSDLLSVEQHYIDILFDDRKCMNISKIAGVGEAKRRAVYADGVIFDSITDFAKHYKSSQSDACGWLSGRMPTPEKITVADLRYADELVSRVFRLPKKRKVILNGVEYPSVTEAGKSIGVNPSRMNSFLTGRKGIGERFGVRELRYAGDIERWRPARPLAIKTVLDGVEYSSQAAANRSIKRRPARRRVLVNGVEFPSVTEAAKAIGVGQKVVSEWLSGRTPIPVRFGISDIRYAGGENRARVNPHKKRVVINGFEFPTVNDAARHLDCNPKLVSKWLCKRNPIPKSRGIYELRYADR